MQKIYSKVDPSVLLHMVFYASDFDHRDGGGRVDIAPEDEFLQVSALHMMAGKTFRPHKHIPCEKLGTITQESWVVIYGSVRAKLYDLDDTIIAEPLLQSGDLSITFRGGHTYEIIDDAKVYEFKTGPYTGQVDDKVFIG